MARSSFAVKASDYPGMTDKVASKEARADKAKVGRTIGKTTGLPIQAYMNCLLAANERHKASDDVLQAMFEAEFPNREAKQGVSQYRTYYNGQAHNQNPKGLHSTRYGDDGQPAKRAAPAKAAGKGGKGGKGKGKQAAKASKGKGKPQPAAA